MIGHGCIIRTVVAAIRWLFRPYFFFFFSLENWNLTICARTGLSCKLAKQKTRPVSRDSFETVPKTTGADHHVTAKNFVQARLRFVEVLYLRLTTETESDLQADKFVEVRINLDKAHGCFKATKISRKNRYTADFFNWGSTLRTDRDEQTAREGAHKPHDNTVHK